MRQTFGVKNLTPIHATAPAVSPGCRRRTRSFVAAHSQEASRLLENRRSRRCVRRPLVVNIVLA